MNNHQIPFISSNLSEIEPFQKNGPTIKIFYTWIDFTKPLEGILLKKVLTMLRFFINRRIASGHHSTERANPAASGGESAVRAVAIKRLIGSKKVRYLRYDSFLATAGYRQYASLLKNSQALIPGFLRMSLKCDFLLPHHPLIPLAWRRSAFPDCIPTFLGMNCNYLQWFW